MAARAVMNPNTPAKLGMMEHLVDGCFGTDPKHHKCVWSGLTSLIFSDNKPRGISSAQVIRDCQTIFNPSSFFAPALEKEREKRTQESKSERKRRRGVKRLVQVKLGHGGTLDPLASGILILGANSGTKWLSAYLGCKKVYETVVVFGASSDSQDRTGKLLRKAPYTHITKSKVIDALQEYLGNIEQTPPLFSALKMNGKPLYEYARQGLPIPRKIPTRTVQVQSIKLVEWYEPGTHRHFWPREQASEEEQRLAQGLEDAAYCVDVGQETGGRQPPKDAVQDDAQGPEALDGVENFHMAPAVSKRKAEGEPQAGEGAEASSKRPKVEPSSKEIHRANSKGYGKDLIPEESPNAPPPWTDDGPPAAKIILEVSSGFYVRSFCHDLGHKLGSAALMAELVRRKQGSFSLDQDLVLQYDDLLQGEEVWGPKLGGMLRVWTDEQKNLCNKSGQSG